MKTGSSWKTTIVGAVLAAVIAVSPIIQTGVVDWKQVGIAALVAIFGFISKDFDLTGGTIVSKIDTTGLSKS